MTSARVHDGAGVISAGMQLANPAGVWRGPMASKGGALFLIHTDALKNVTYRPHESCR